MHFALQVGSVRQAEATRRGCRNRIPIINSAGEWSVHISGALGEMAAVKALGTFWPASVNAAKSEPDLPPDIQVRTRPKSHHDLIIRPDDPDHHRYILVTGSGPVFSVIGWIKGADGKRDRWFRDRGDYGAPCYWIPQHSLVQIHPPEIPPENILPNKHVSDGFDGIRPNRIPF